MIEYHEATKHSLASVQSNRHGLDWANQPLPFKIYTSLSPIGLPLEFPRSEWAALAAIVKARGARVGVAGQALHVFECHALLQQVSYGGHPERVRREVRGQLGILQPTLDHLADIVHVNSSLGELAGLAPGGSE